MSLTHDAVEWTTDFRDVGADGKLVVKSSDERESLGVDGRGVIMAHPTNWAAFSSRKTEDRKIFLGETQHDDR